MSTLGGIPAGLYLRASIQEQYYAAIFTVQPVIQLYLSLSQIHYLQCTETVSLSLSIHRKSSHIIAKQAVKQSSLFQLQN